MTIGGEKVKVKQSGLGICKGKNIERTMPSNEPMTPILTCAFSWPPMKVAFNIDG